MDESTVAPGDDGSNCAAAEDIPVTVQDTPSGAPVPATAISHEAATGSDENGAAGAEVGAKRSACETGGAAGAEPPAKQQAVAPASTADPDLQPPWTAHVSGRTGKTYWYNPETKETTWIRPVKKEEPPPPDFSEVTHSNLYVKNLADHIDDFVLGNIFARFGQIKSARIQRDSLTQRSRNFGFVKFETIDCAKMAVVHLNNAVIEGRQLMVKFADFDPEQKKVEQGGQWVDSKPGGGNPLPSDNVYVKGLPQFMTEEAVHALFSRYGTITQFKVLLAKGTNAFTGEALVRLGSIEQAEYAIRNINNMVIPGAIAPILVRYANPSKPKTDMGGGSADWELHTAEDGRPYYWNSKTQESRWDPPPAASSANPMDGWAMHMTEDGRPYYFNSRTQESRWDPPTATATALVPQSRPALQPVVEMCTGPDGVQHPVRPGAENCSFFMKTGGCKFGETCKFNHPPDMLGKGSLAVAKEPTYKKVELRQEMNIITVADSRQTGPTSTTAEGYPIRPGMEDCIFYIKSGVCKRSPWCKYNHPPKDQLGLIGTLSQPNMAPWNPKSALGFTG